MVTRTDTSEPSFACESGKTHSLKGGPDNTSTVHNLCRQDNYRPG